MHHINCGHPRLVVTIGSVITLAVLMYMTARLDWNRVFARQVTEG
ncbi:MAG: cell envelope integrity protein CreD [Gammaproteobacteria bacterium]|nr:cell envelope integrity protein CreD [Gammaproteobacteria bacterium]